MDCIVWLWNGFRTHGKNRELVDSEDRTRFRTRWNAVNEPSNDSLEVDDDGDGFSEEEGDCDDTNPNVSPENSEIPYDGIDNDCDGDTGDDIDGDGFDRVVDCDDFDENVNPDAEDNICDGFDDNCDGQVDEEAQPDGEEPFDAVAPQYLGDLNSLNDIVYSENFIFPTSDEDGFQFWFEDDFDFCTPIFGTIGPFCDVIAPLDVDIQVDLYFQSSGSSSFNLCSLLVTAGTVAQFEGGYGSCGGEDSGVFQFDITSVESLCESYTINCIKDDDWFYTTKYSNPECQNFQIEFRPTMNPLEMNAYLWVCGK